MSEVLTPPVLGRPFVAAAIFSCHSCFDQLGLLHPLGLSSFVLPPLPSLLSESWWTPPRVLHQHVCASASFPTASSERAGLDLLFSALRNFSLHRRRCDASRAARPAALRRDAHPEKQKPAPQCPINPTPPNQAEGSEGARRRLWRLTC